MCSRYESCAIDSIDPIVLVSGADDGYALPLAVTIRSVIDHLADHRRLDVYILDGGITEASKQRLAQSWQDPRVRIEWVTVNEEAFLKLPVSLHVTSATYLRLAIAEHLPTTVSRAIYLDADMLVCRDLGLLWDEPQGDALTLAVQDYAAPYVDASTRLASYAEARPYLAATRPIANFRELNLSPNAEYFNGGLLVIDIKRWRLERLLIEFLDCLSKHREHVLWWDQYVLNVVLAGKWRGLDLRWNQGAHLYMYPTAAKSPFDQLTFAQLRSDPWIVHFCSPSKPWDYFCRHPATNAFHQCLKRTEWRDWRAERPKPFLRVWWGHHYKPVRNRWKTEITELKSSLGFMRRAA